MNTKQGRPGGEEKMEFFSLRLRSDLLDEVRTFADETDRSVSAILRRVIENGLPAYMGKSTLDDEDKDPNDYILTLESGESAAAQ